MSSTTSSATPTSSFVVQSTTFTPAQTCSSLTMLSSPGYYIWYGEPMPVPATTASACYAASWIDEYQAVGTASYVPAASPLVCPVGWTDVYDAHTDYIACCPSGYLLTPPKITVDTNRPAFGGTCYSNFVQGQTYPVVAYNSASVTGTLSWVASVTSAQAYAHVIDGFGQQKVGDTSPASIPSVSAQTSSSTHSTAVTSTSTSSSSVSVTPASVRHSLSGAAVAGVVVGCIVAVAIVLAIGFALLTKRRRQRRNRDLELPAYGDEKRAEDTDNVGGEKAQEMLTPSNAHELAQGEQRQELQSPTARYEMDSTSPTAELESPRVDEAESLGSPPSYDEGEKS